MDSDSVLYHGLDFLTTCTHISNGPELDISSLFNSSTSTRHWGSFSALFHRSGLVLSIETPTTTTTTTSSSIHPYATVRVRNPESAPVNQLGKPSIRLIVSVPRRLPRKPHPGVDVDVVFTLF